MSDERPPRRRSPRKRRRKTIGESLSSEEMDESNSSSSSIAGNATTNHPSSVLLVGKTRGAGAGAGVGGRSSGGSRKAAANHRKRKVVGKGGGGREEEEEEQANQLKIDANNNVSTTIDLRGHANTPDELKRYLNDNNEKSPSTIIQQKLGGGGSGGEQQVVRKWSVITDVFPRGCMQVLLDHIGSNNIRITKFENHYGNIYKYQIQNPDLKLLLKHHGKWLTHLRISPLNNNTNNNNPPPKLQGCGYRWITLHTRQLQVLELSLLYDTKQQLLDLSRRTPLRVSALQELVLRDVRVNNNQQQQLIDLISRATNLERLVLSFAEEEEEEEGKQTTTTKRNDNIVSLLQSKAKEIGNHKLQVEIIM